MARYRRPAAENAKRILPLFRWRCLWHQLPHCSHRAHYWVPRIGQCKLRGWQETRGAIGTADTFILSRQVQQSSWTPCILCSHGSANRHSRQAAAVPLLSCFLAELTYAYRTKRPPATQVPRDAHAQCTHDRSCSMSFTKRAVRDPADAVLADLPSLPHAPVRLRNSQAR